MFPIAAAVDRALHRLYAVCGAIAAIAIVALAMLVAASIISRLLGVYVGGLTEGAGYAMATAGSFGLAYTFGSGGHIRVDLVLGMLSTRARSGAELIAMILTTAAILYLAWFMVRMVRISFEYGDLSDGSDGLPLWLPQLPAAIGFCVFALALLHHLINYCLTGKMPWTRPGENFLSDDGTK
ncbi:MAG: TRAP transporter small permease [Alphaproteobacteria bacterium]|nr:TRAP transporter small permease [Alphaproteobacteria bacterium]